MLLTELFVNRIVSMNKIIIVEGLDNSGKNTWVTNHHPNAIVVDFPIRNGKHGEEISSFLRGEIPYSTEVEEWFLENRLEWYSSHAKHTAEHTVGITEHTVGITEHTVGITEHTVGITEHTVGTTVLVRSGISYLVYKWYRTGIKPTPEEFSRERELLKDTTVVFLNTEFENTGKKEIYDSLSCEKKEPLKLLFTEVIADLTENLMVGLAENTQ